MQDALPSAVVAEAGRLLYGDDWQSPLARDLRLNLRTVQRIAAAAGRNEPYRIADGVLVELAALLSSRSSACQHLAITIAGLRDG